MLNKNPEDYELKLERFQEMLQGVTEAKDVLTGLEMTMNDVIQLKANTPMILELR